MPLLARIIRRVFRWLVTLAVLAVVMWLAFIFGGRALCRVAISQMARLTNVDIQTSSVDFRSNGSVFIKGLVVNPRGSEGPDQIILKARDVHARFDPASIFILRPQLKRIDVNDFVFNALYDLDTGRWNLSALRLRSPRTSYEGMPLITLGSGELQYRKVSGGQAKVAVSMPLSAKLGFDRQGGKGYSYDLKTGKQYGGSGESHLKGFWRPGYLEVTGGIASADVCDLEMGWTIDYMAAELKYEPNDSFTLDMRIFDMRSHRSPDLDKFAQMGPESLGRSTPFAALQRFFARFSPRGHINFNVNAWGNLKELSKSVLAGSVNCKDVAISYREFPYLINKLEGKVDFTENGATLNKLSGSHGDVKLFLDGWTRGFPPDWQYDIRVTSDNMNLDDDLYNALNPGQKKAWELFWPSGAAAIDYRLTRGSPEDRARRLVADLKGVDAVYRGFPYPLRSLSGRLDFVRDNVVITNVVSDANGCRITLNGKVTGRGTDRAGYDVSIKAENIPFDATMRSALPEQQKDLYDQFNPTGLADGDIRISKPGRPGIAPTFIADMSLRQASLRSDRLPLPVTDVTSGMVFAPDQIDIKHFSGRYGQTPVSIDGQIWPGQDGQPLRYSLVLEFEDTPLNDDLFKLLPKWAAKAVADFRPQGKIDLTAEMSKLGPSDSADYKVSVHCLGNSVDLPQFSYPLKDITGDLKITPQAIEFRDVNAAPGDAVWIKSNTAFIKLDGSVSLEGNAFKSALVKIKANDIFFDRRLGAALPVGMHPLYNKFLPPAHFDLDLNEVRITPTPDGRKNVDIEGRAKLEQCDLEIYGATTQFDANLAIDHLTIAPADSGERYIDVNTLVDLENCSLPISGAKAELDADLRILGRYKTNHGFEDCRLLLDGRTFKILGKTFRNVKTQIDYDPELQNWAGDELTADCYGGKLTGKLEFNKTADAAARYTLQTSFQNVDLSRFLSDTRMRTGPDDDHTTGTMEGTLNIGARLGDSSTRLGTCRLSIVDMQVGRLSPLAKLLQVLRFSEPTKYAFDKMFVDSYIKGDDLLVRKLDLSGKSAAFYGSGLMDLRTTKIDLELIARGKRLATAEASVIGALAEGLGRAVVQIDVIGDFYDPQVITRPLPFIKGTLDILGKPIEPE